MLGIGSLPEHGRGMCEQHARDPYNSPLRPACDPAPLAFREAAVGSGAVSRGAYEALN